MTKDKKILIGVGAGMVLVIAGAVTTAIILDQNKRKSIFNQVYAVIQTGNQQQNGGSGSAFDPKVFMTASNVTLSDADATTYADKIWEAKAPSLSNILSSDQTGVVAIFKELTSKADVSKLANTFFQNHAQDLYTYLGSFMDCSKDFFGDKTNYMQQVNDIVASLS